jgi:hypothetical protein
MKNRRAFSSIMAFLAGWVAFYGIHLLIPAFR